MLVITSLGCGESSSDQPAKTGCGNQTAVIGVKNATLSIECGCDETSGTTAVEGKSFTCTVPAENWVVFDYTGSKQIHQIESYGSLTFPMSPLSDPASSQPISNHAVKVDQKGTYQFRDRLLPSLSGQVITR